MAHNLLVRVAGLFTGSVYVLRYGSFLLASVRLSVPRLHPEIADYGAILLARPLRRIFCRLLSTVSMTQVLVLSKCQFGLFSNR